MDCGEWGKIGCYLIFSRISRQLTLRTMITPAEPGISIFDQTIKPPLSYRRVCSSMVVCPFANVEVAGSIPGGAKKNGYSILAWIHVVHQFDHMDCEFFQREFMDCGEWEE